MAEAQRLITVSLGKIAQSKGQRGGASLYRNLLVSTVLHKARHVFMSENFTAMIQARRAQAEKVRESQESLEEPSRPQTPAPSVLAVTNPPTVEPVEDKENTPPKSIEVVKTENTPEELVEEQKDVKDKSCAKCTKRRLTDVQPQNGGALCESSSPNKRAKREHDSINDKCDSKATEDVSPSTRREEPMQTEQISNLVNRFNSGLSGLLGTKLPSKHAENSDSFVPFCGTQVSFSESLGSRPAIALTV